MIVLDDDLVAVGQAQLLGQQGRIGVEQHHGLINECVDQILLAVTEMILDPHRLRGLRPVGGSGVQRVGHRRAFEKGGVKRCGILGIVVAHLLGQRLVEAHLGAVAISAVVHPPRQRPPDGRLKGLEFLLPRLQPQLQLAHDGKVFQRQRFIGIRRR